MVDMTVPSSGVSSVGTDRNRGTTALPGSSGYRSKCVPTISRTIGKQNRQRPFNDCPGMVKGVFFLPSMLFLKSLAPQAGHSPRLTRRDAALFKPREAVALLSSSSSKWMNSRPGDTKSRYGDCSRGDTGSRCSLAFPSQGSCCG